MSDFGGSKPPLYICVASRASGCPPDAIIRAVAQTHKYTRTGRSNDLPVTLCYFSAKDIIRSFAGRGCISYNSVIGLGVIFSQKQYDFARNVVHEISNGSSQSVVDQVIHIKASTYNGLK